MVDKIFTESILKEGNRLVSSKKVLTIIFSKSTYQAEVEDEHGVQWTFLQCKGKQDIIDLFCECGGSKEKGCSHLAASVEAIFRGYSEPLHVRYESSFWKALLENSALKNHYAPIFLDKEGQAYLISKEDLPIVKIVPKSFRAKEHCRITIDERVEETEETSIKFSNLEVEELERYKKGDPSEALKFELSWWSDLAKYLLFLEDEGQKPFITFIEEEGKHPQAIKVEMDDFSLYFSLHFSDMEKIIPPLNGYRTNLPLFDLAGKDIENVSYDEKSLSFSLVFKKSDPHHNKGGIEVGEWRYLFNKGFFPKNTDPLLQTSRIEKENCELFLERYKENCVGWLKGTKIYPAPKKVQFDLFFDKEHTFHISIYLFEKGDLAKEGVQFFGKWVYIPDKGFYSLEGTLFKGVERVIKNEMISEFVDRHKTFLSTFSDFAVHLTNIESSIRYGFEGSTLVILGDDLHDEDSGVIDCGKYLYVKGQGFFIQGGGRYDKHVFPGMRIQEDEITHFITANKEELETVNHFFVHEEGIEKTGLNVLYDEEKGILIEAKYHFTKEILQFDPVIYGDFVYLKNKGFMEIPLSMRLPTGYTKDVEISKEQLPFFLKHELSKIEPYILHLDKRLIIPTKLSLRVNYIEKVAGVWRMSFTFNSPLGEVRACQVYQAYVHFAPFLLTDAGMLILKEEKFHWLMRLAHEQIDFENNLIELSTLDWIKLTVTEDVYLPASSQDPVQQQLLNILKNLHFDTVSEMPDIKGLKSTLRPYQEIGVRWLWFLYSFGLPGGFLCDDMGLGKTHQSMALFAALFNAKKKGDREKCLVVCPTSVIYHWEELLKNFLSKGNILFYHGPFRKSKELSKKGYDIILTTYGIIRSDKEIFQKMDFEVAIYDEIQVAKNQKSQIHLTLKKLSTKMNLALTGTPIENSLGELKSLFDIILPKYLPSENEFREKFVIPIEKDRNIEANNLLSALIKPFVLRRKKTEVLEDLPEKIEEISYTELLPKQRELYTKVASKSKEMLEDEDQKHFHIHVFALLNTLKQICNHPALYYDDIKNYQEYASGKWELFVELLDESRQSKQKVVVFTQYLGMMDIIESYLKENSIKYAAIRGSTSNRKEQVNYFQTNSECEVFVGSLNAAGVGIDLTAASVVIHYDRWWNPARENQATDRVHRMGQSKGVSVFKFVTKHSLEEHIHQIIEKKTKLIETIVGYDSEDSLKKLGKDELKKILKSIQSDL